MAAGERGDVQGEHPALLRVAEDHGRGRGGAVSAVGLRHGDVLLRQEHRHASLTDTPPRSGWRCSSIQTRRLPTASAKSLTACDRSPANATGSACPPTSTATVSSRWRRARPTFRLTTSSGPEEEEFKWAYSAQRQKLIPDSPR